MPSETSERIKLYAVIALAIVAAAVAYFRFLHETGPKVPSPPAPGPDSRAPAVTLDLELPEIDASLLEDRRLGEKTADALPSTGIRDLFSRLTVSQKPAPREIVRKAEIPRASLKLKGTILGGKKPIAIINGQLLGTGDKIGGYEVLGIGKNEVLLRAGDEVLALEVVSEAADE